MEAPPTSKRRLRGFLAVGAVGLFAALAAANFAWGWSLRQSARRVADRYVDAILTRRQDEAIALRFHPDQIGNGTVAEAFLRYPKTMKGLDYCPMTEFCLGRIADSQVTIVGVNSISSVMQAAPDGSRMEAVWEAPVRYRISLGGRTLTLDVVLHGHAASLTPWSKVKWHVFNVNPILK